MEMLQSYDDPIQWQINRRFRIQNLLFDIHKFISANSRLPKAHDDHWHAITRIVHAAFSLWRSAFLTDVKRKRAQFYKDMVELIDKVLKHNAISFADDHRMCELSVDYYNYNARYRLERMMKGPYVNLAGLQVIDEMLEQNVEASSLDQRMLWDLYFIALAQSFDLFQRRWAAARRTAARRRRRRKPASAIAAGSKARSLRRR